jgi:hypothetical protein
MSVPENHLNLGVAEERRLGESLIFERRRSIEAVIAESGNVPSLREMARLLVVRNGIEASYVTVKSDYAALGIVSHTKLPPKPQTLMLPCVAPS